MASKLARPSGRVASGKIASSSRGSPACSRRHCPARSGSPRHRPSLRVRAPAPPARSSVGSPRPRRPSVPRHHFPRDARPLAAPGRPAVPASRGQPRIGSTVLDAAQLLPDYEALLARRVGAVELERLASAIADRYRRAGFALVSVFVPPQSGEGGIAIIRVMKDASNASRSPATRFPTDTCGASRRRCDPSIRSGKERSSARCCSSAIFRASSWLTTGCVRSMRRRAASNWSYPCAGAPWMPRWHSTIAAVATTARGSSGRAAGSTGSMRTPPGRRRSRSSPHPSARAKSATARCR